MDARRRNHTHSLEQAIADLINGVDDNVLDISDPASPKLNPNDPPSPVFQPTLDGLPAMANADNTALIANLEHPAGPSQPRNHLPPPPDTTNSFPHGTDLFLPSATSSPRLAAPVVSVNSGTLPTIRGVSNASIVKQGPHWATSPPSKPLAIWTDPHTPSSPRPSHLAASSSKRKHDSSNDNELMTKRLCPSVPAIHMARTDEPAADIIILSGDTDDEGLREISSSSSPSPPPTARRKQPPPGPCSACIIMGGAQPQQRRVDPFTHIKKVRPDLQNWEAVARAVGAQSSDTERVRQLAPRFMRELPGLVARSIAKGGL